MMLWLMISKIGCWERHWSLSNLSTCCVDLEKASDCVHTLWRPIQEYREDGILPIGECEARDEDQHLWIQGWITFSEDSRTAEILRHLGSKWKSSSIFCSRVRKGAGDWQMDLGPHPIWARECLGIYIREPVEVRREGEEGLGCPTEAATTDLELDKQLKDLWQDR